MNCLTILSDKDKPIPAVAEVSGRLVKIQRFLFHLPSIAHRIVIRARDEQTNPGLEMAFSRFLGTRRSCSCLNGSLASLRAFCIQGKSYGSSAPAVEEKIAWTPRSRRTGAIGVKLGMTKMWTKKGDSFPVTLIRVGSTPIEIN